MKSLLLALALTGLSAQGLATPIAHQHVPALENFQTKPIFADLKDLKALGIPVFAKDELAEVGLAVVTPQMQQKIQERAHLVGKCGGFESLPAGGPEALSAYVESLGNLNQRVQSELQYARAPFQLMALPKDGAIEAALNELKESNLRADVQWLSSFPTRYNKAADPNVHVLQMKQKIEAILQSSKVPYEVTLIGHRQTKQQSLRVRLPGSERPDEIIVMGGHLDSINQGWGGTSAPGADDNASGSSNLMDILRVVTQKAQAKRSIEFFWYAGEESGLLGSSEIAQTYKQQNKNVIAVMQLDMTLFPGAGEMVLGSMTDFTSAWLRDYLKAANDTYLHIQIAEDKCGYGCSDHASWYRQGYSTLMPFEATMRSMNGNIHTSKDTVTPAMSFSHSMIYSKIGVILAMDLANSTQKQLY